MTRIPDRLSATQKDVADLKREVREIHEQLVALTKERVSERQTQSGRSWNEYEGRWVSG